MEEFKEIKDKIDIKDINSLIIKKIFSFLNKKQILDIIIYNKKLQKMFSVDIKDYKILSGKYKINEQFGKGREYIINTNILIFEGEYKNKKRNRKGKEYFENGKLFFEGEYLNGKRWNGKGKEYQSGEVIFEGEYSNGKRWNGKGKEYKNEELTFEGEYLNGEKINSN